MNGHSRGITEAKSIQKEALLFLVLAAIVIDAFALNMLSDLRYGNYESYYSTLIACIMVSLFGGMLTIAFPVLLLRKLREPSLRLILQGPKPEFGETFKGHIVVSMAANRAPPIVATLKLFRSQSDSIEFMGGSSVVWEKEIIIKTFKSIGAKQCRGEFEILLLDQSLADLRHSGSFNWELFVRSSDPKHTFSEVFKIPVVF